ncbi:MAG: prolyl oligopeptidase family serine peptidase [Gemmatimonadetes bacterium]|nr:prolyl oligopeptidase family serine peptidase [Gemmatimonadota bacterium]
MVDIPGAAHCLVSAGVADTSRMAIGGWRQVAILTDHTTASDTRCTAAASGAGSAKQPSTYGSDQQVVEHHNGLGAPRKSPARWQRLIYPFHAADRLGTPTLHMIGERDVDVPTSGSEQVCGALESPGAETRRVVYPSRFHGLTVRSCLADRFPR